jgi:hypothetical protein
MANYEVENQWGGTSAPWHPGGTWTLGARNNQNVVAISISSQDGGKTLTGTMTYSGEGPIGFRAKLISKNTYTVENQWGGDSAPWHPGGTWVIGARDEQRVVQLNVSSSDNGTTLNGDMTYDGEGPIGFKAVLVTVAINSYHVENQWGGNAAPWHPGGTWIIGARDTQRAVQLSISSGDNGLSFTGTMTYSGEGPIGFRARQISGNQYTVENQWGGNTAPWHPGGTWVIGARDAQRAVKVDISSADSGESFNGEMTYAGEGPIGFKAALVLQMA